MCCASTKQTFRVNTNVSCKHEPTPVFAAHAAQLGRKPEGHRRRWSGWGGGARGGSGPSLERRHAGVWGPGVAQTPSEHQRGDMAHDGLRPLHPGIHPVPAEPRLHGDPDPAHGLPQVQVRSCPERLYSEPRASTGKSRMKTTDGRRSSN